MAGAAGGHVQADGERRRQPDEAEAGRPAQEPQRQEREAARLQLNRLMADVISLLVIVIAFVRVCAVH